MDKIAPELLAALNDLPPEISPEDFQFNKQIDTGAYGYIYEAHWQSQKVAVKVLRNLRDGTRQTSEALVREADLLHAAKHPHVIMLLAVVNRPRYLALVFPFMSSGALDTFLGSFNLSKSKIEKIAFQLALALEFVHACGMIHMDIKAPNILLDHELNAKLCDFGMAVKLNDGQHSFESSKQLGSYRWSGPEIYQTNSEGNYTYSKAYDVYSYGWVVEVLIRNGLPTAEPLSDLENDEVAKIHKKHGPFPALGFQATEGAATLFKECIRYRPEKRLTMQQVVAEFNKGLKLVQ